MYDVRGSHPSKHKSKCLVLSCSFFAFWKGQNSVRSPDVHLINAISVGVAKAGMISSNNAGGYLADRQCRIISS